MNIFMHQAPTDTRKGKKISRNPYIRISYVGSMIGRAVTVLLTVMSIAAMTVPGAYAGTITAEYIADGDTRNTYTESLGDTDSTRYAGRIWTDKSVSDESVTFENPQDANQSVTVQKGDSDFLVTYSAMATSVSVKEQTPTDTVFILDLSASMTWGYEKPQEAPNAEESRLQAMVDAVNSAIDKLVKSNSENRIAITSFTGNIPTTDNQLMPYLVSGANLLSKIDNGQYLSLKDWDQGKNGDDNGADKHAKDNDDASAYVQCNYTKRKVKTDGGTNIQAGLFTGMSILANNNDTTYVTSDGQTVNRIPNVVIMSDGAPTTFSSSNNAIYMSYNNKDDKNCKADADGPRTGEITEDGEGFGGDPGTSVCRNNDKYPVYSGPWWSENTGEPIGAGDNNNPDSADGVMALLMASYLKKKISEQYSHTGATQTANVYTVGFATDVQNEAMALMANIVLNPAEYLDDAENFDNNDDEDKNDEEIRQVYTAIQKYLKHEDAWTQGSIGGGSSSDEVPFVLRWNEDHPEDDIDSVYYPTEAFSASDGNQLNAALTRIAELITEQAKSPTQTDSNDPDGNTSGYITYVDPIGEYMCVDSVKALIWAGMVFDKVTSTTGDGGTTYTFKNSAGGTAIDSPIYGTHSVNDIKVTTYTVSDSSPEHQELKVEIPANSIPVRVNTISLNGEGDPVSNESNAVLPLRLVYGVSLEEEVKNEDGTVNWRNISDAYAKQHVDEDGNVLFYTNLYSAQRDPDAESTSTLGDATVTFEPAEDNPFYYMQEDTPLYSCITDGTGVHGGAQISADEVDSKQSYCFAISYYENTENGVEKRVAWASRTGDTLSGYTVFSDGQLYVKAGSPRLGNLRDVSKDKDANETGTASRRLRPTWDPETSRFVVYLGNNGRMGIAPSAVTASVTVRKTFTGRPWNDEDKFTFTLEPIGDNAESAPMPEPQDGVVRVDGEAASVTIGKPSSGSETTNSVTVDFKFPATSLDGNETIYQYEVREKDGDLPSVSYDRHTATVTIKVSQDKATVSVSNAGAPSGSDAGNTTAAAFTNLFASVSTLPLTGGSVTTRGYVAFGAGLLLLACGVWLMARHRRAGLSADSVSTTVLSSSDD